MAKSPSKGTKTRVKKKVPARDRLLNALLHSSEEKMYADALDVIRKDLESPYGAFGYIDSNGDLILPSLTRGVWDVCRVADKSIIFPKNTWGQSTWGKVLKSRKPQIINKQSERTPEGHIPIRRHMVVPVLEKKKAIGLLMVANQESPYTKEQLSRLVSHAADIAPVLTIRLRNRAEVARREEAEKELRKHQSSLERLVKEKTKDLRVQEEGLRHVQKMDAIGRLAGGIAHEFNNVLMAIDSHCDLVLHNLSPGDPIRDDLLKIRRSADRAADLTRHIMAFSRQQPMTPISSDLNRVIQGARGLMGRTIGEDIALRVTRCQDAWKFHADVEMLQQVLVHLALNARDAMPNGGTMRIWSRNVTVPKEGAIGEDKLPQGDYALLSISDSGEGIRKDDLPHIFEPFYTTKEVGQGTGLGLSTVYGIIKQSKGFIFVSSTTGKGTNFRIYLPRCKGGKTKARKKETGKSEKPKEPAVVLLVEDEEIVLSVTQRILQRFDFKVLTALNGKDALKIATLRKSPIDVLVSDVIMPGMSGPEMATKLKKKHPETRVLFMTGYPREELKNRTDFPDEFSLLYKPVPPFDLRDAILNLLKTAPKKKKGKKKS